MSDLSSAASDGAMPNGGGQVSHVFVYGTLLPGDVRFHLMAPFVVDDGWADTVRGQIYDTGFDYPALELGANSDLDGSIVHGRTFGLIQESRDRALEVLDEVEGIVEGDYVRVRVVTGRGVAAWVYVAGRSLLDSADGAGTLIDGGDWLAHRPTATARPLVDPERPAPDHH